MELIEIKQKEAVVREEAAARLRELADQLARHNEVAFERSGMRFRAGVPQEIQFKFEFEIGDDGTELEIELSW